MKVFLIIIAFSLVGEVNAIGRLTVAEIILAGCVAVALVRAPRPSGDVLRFYVMAALWAAGAVAADLYNQSAPEDYMRGWSKIVFFVLNFTGLRLLVGNDRDRLTLFIFCLMLATALRVALGVMGDDLGLTGGVFGDDWKFGYGPVASASALLASAWLLRQPWGGPAAVALPLAAAAVALLCNARSLMGQTLLSGVTAALTGGRRRPPSIPKLLALGTALFFAGILAVNVNEYAAGGGILGLEAQDKYLQQTQGNLTLLQGGRNESLASIQAIIDSPIFGHGSWARNITYVMLLMDRLEEAGMNVVRDGTVDDLIPSHSHLLGAWVEHGVLGAAFWCWAFWVALKGLWAAIRHPTPLTGFVTLIGISLVWDILFSPFGLERRVTTAASLYLMMLVAEQPAITVQPVLARWSTSPVRLKSSGVLP